MPISGCHDLPLATFNLPSRNRPQTNAKESPSDTGATSKEKNNIVIPEFSAWLTLVLEQCRAENIRNLPRQRAPTPLFPERRPREACSMPISGCHDLPLATFNLPSRNRPQTNAKESPSDIGATSKEKNNIVIPEFSAWLTLVLEQCRAENIRNLPRQRAPTPLFPERRPREACSMPISGCHDLPLATFNLPSRNSSQSNRKRIHQTKKPSCRHSVATCVSDHSRGQALAPAIALKTNGNNAPHKTKNPSCCRSRGGMRGWPLPWSSPRPRKPPQNKRQQRPPTKPKNPRAAAPEPVKESPSDTGATSKEKNNIVIPEFSAWLTLVLEQCRAENIRNLPRQRAPTPLFPERRPREACSMPISGCHDLPLATFNLPSRNSSQSNRKRIPQTKNPLACPAAGRGRVAPAA